MKLSVLPIAVFMTQVDFLLSNLLQDFFFFFPVEAAFQGENIFKEDSDASLTWTAVIIEASISEWPFPL